MITPTVMITVRDGGGGDYYSDDDDVAFASRIISFFVCFSGRSVDVLWILGVLKFLKMF